MNVKIIGKMKQLPTRDELMDMWLLKYHNITCKEVVEKYPEEVKSPKWFELFPCTQEQSDEWEKEVKELYLKKLKINKRLFERSWPFTYLDCSPYIKRDE